MKTNLLSPICVNVFIFEFRCHSTSYIARGLEKNCQYEFRVRAQNMHGMSEPSRPSCPVTPQDPVNRPEEKETEGECVEALCDQTAALVGS